MQTSYILIIILVLIMILSAIAILSDKEGKKRPSTYYTFFIMGVIWAVFGLVVFFMNKTPLMGNGLFTLGVIFTILGIANKDKWNIKRK